MEAGRILRQPAVAMYLFSTGMASLGSDILVTIIFKQAFDETGDELSIGLLGLAQFVPSLLLVVVSGWAADRFDRRRVTALFLGARVLCAAALVWYSVADQRKLWILLVIAVVFGAADHMMGPARRAMSPLVVAPRDLPHLVALWTVTFTAAQIVGPIAGGFLYSAGPEVGYAVAVVLQAIGVPAALLIRYVRQPERLTARPSVHTALEGVRFVWKTPVVLACISLDLFAVLFGGAVALIAPVASERLGVGDIGYGFLRAAPGVGSAIMAVGLALFPLRRRIGPTLLAVVFLFGAGTVVFGITRNFAVAFMALVVLSAVDMVSVYIRGTLVPMATPDDQLGRVSAVEMVFIGASNELGAFESGVAARLVGLPWSIAGGGLITMLVAGAFWFWFPTVRRIDTFEEVRPEARAATRLPPDASM